MSERITGDGVPRAADSASAPGAMPQELLVLTLDLGDAVRVAFDGGAINRRYVDPPSVARAAIWSWVQSDRARVREETVRECDIEAAYREGFDDGCDPAWAAKQLRRAGVEAEPHENVAMDYFWRGSNARARHAALLPAPGQEGEG